MTGSSGVAIESRDDAVAFLDARIGSGVKPGLERISGLLALMGDPQSTYPIVHIAGTNGKTTVARMVQQILGAHGLATGGFTSPHLHAVEERFNLHGAPIDGDSLAEGVRDIAWFVEAFEREHETTVTYFEVTAALAMSIFANASVDVGVVEVGLGGRLDATNAVEADVSVLTGVDIDHAEFLGSTIGEIAREKAAILKQDGVLVSGPLADESIEPVSRRVAETGSNWIRFGHDFEVSDAAVAVGGWQCSIRGVHSDYDDLFVPLHGRHQVDHLATAIASCEMLLGRHLDDQSLAFAVASLSSPGRLEVVRRRPLVLVDGAHNAQGFRGLAATIDTEFPAIQWHLVIGVRGERSVGDLVAPLHGSIAAVYAAAPDDPAAIDPLAVAADAGKSLDVPYAAYEAPELAVAEAVAAAGPEGGVIVAGSLYLVGDVREAFGTVSDRSTEAHVRFEAEVDEDLDEDLAEF